MKMENRCPKSSCSILIRIAAVFIAALIFLTAFPAAGLRASAQSTTPVYYGDFAYVIDVDKDTGKFVASIFNFTPADTSKTDYNITIPDTIDKDKYPYPVTSISPNAFNRSIYKDKITKVKMPNTITSVGDYAFLDCKNLESVDFGSELLTIGKYAFAGCYSLKEAKLPQKLTEIGDSAFTNCTHLEKVEFPKTLNYIGQGAFTNCTTLKAAELPETLKAIGSSAFSGCTSLGAVKLPSAITSIDANTFLNCSSLQTITFPDTLKTIGTNAFSGCSSLMTLTFPDRLEEVGSQAFSNCRNLTAVIVPYDLQNISDTAFMNSPVEIWGYSGSYADNYAYRNGIRQFHPIGTVQRVTFSADNYYVTVNNIVIQSSKGNLIIPPANVVNGEMLTISVTAPTDYLVDYMTINNEPFVNGGTYTVGSTDVNIFVSYKRREATTTSSPAITTVTTSNLPQTSTSQNTTTASAAAPNDDDDDDEEEIPINDTTNNGGNIEDEGTNQDSYVKVDSDLRDVGGKKVRIITRRDYFIGPATVRVTNTPEAEDAAKGAVEATDTENAQFYAFDISLYDERGKENQGVLATGTITFQIPVPDSLLPYANSIKVYHIVDDAPVLVKSNIIEDINGVKKVQFEAKEFSPYMLVAVTDGGTVPTIDEDTTKPANNPSDDDDGDEDVGIITDDDDKNNNNTPDAAIVDNDKTKNTYPSYNGNINPHTGAIIAGGAICGISLICIPLVKSRKKRKRTKSPIE